MIIERAKGEQIATLTPVVGYQHIQGGVVFPLTVMNSKGLTRGRALITPDGFVSDPSFGLVCGNRDEWMQLTSTTAYWEGESKAPKADNKTVAEGYDSRAPLEIDWAFLDDLDMDLRSRMPDGRVLPTTGGGAHKDEPKAKSIPDKPPGKPQVFQTTSFWMKKASGIHPPRLFKAEGGVEVPAKNDPRYDKIKRDEWLAAKKEGMAVMEWPEDAEMADRRSANDFMDSLPEDDGTGLI